MKVLIVDDEPLAREGLRLLLAATADVEIVGECTDGIAAVTALRNGGIDLAFLDINMPGCDGLEVVAAVGVDQMPLVIFLTAYDKHAVEAFTLNALDYLLKPVSGQRFQESLHRARTALQQQQQHTQGEQLQGLLQLLSQQAGSKPEERLMIRSASHVHFLKPSEIGWVQAEGDYVSLHTADKSHLVRETMKQMEAKLSPHGFQRIHRSSLVNLGAIRELVADHNGDYTVRLHDNTVLKLSRAWRDELCAKLQKGVQQVLE